MKADPLDSTFHSNITAAAEQTHRSRSFINPTSY